MIANLQRESDRWILELDQATVDACRLDVGVPLEILADGGTLVIAPAGDPDRTTRFNAALEKVNLRYGRALKALAE